MLRVIGVLLLMAGSVGTGWSIKEKWKASLEVLYQMRQILEMFQNEIAYSRASLPEACSRIGARVEEPYRGAFISIREEMLANRGLPFDTIWKEEMKKCLEKLPAAGGDKRVFLDFGSCIGYMDGEMQAEAVEQYVHKLNISIERMEKDMWNKYKVIMSLSIMGGLMLAIMLL